MRNITVIGAGYVGLVTGTGFADLGNKVCCLDIDESKISMLQNGEVPIFEPGLQEMIQRNVQAGRLTFTTDYGEALADAEFVFIAVGTPEGVDGEADLKYVGQAAKTIAKTMRRPMIIVNKSTVPVGTGDWVADIIRTNQPEPIDFAVVSNPEFLREGSAIIDSTSPDRIVLGSLNKEAANKVAELYLSLRSRIIITDLRTAEMIKYASNAFLATRISFINEIANICEQLGADVKEVATGMGYDKRIGHYFLDAGVGYGGSCFPKDVKALAHMATTHGTHPQLLKAVMDINQHQRIHVIQKLRELLGQRLNGKVIGLLGLAFKPNTDDMREAPAAEIGRALLRENAIVKGYDPEAMNVAAKMMPNLQLAEDVYSLAEGCDALILLTEWNEFKHLDLPRVKELMRQPVFIDGRNLYEPDMMTKCGFIYRGVGRGYQTP
ncbi:MAG: UDP-glucose 6-dehydrogenase [Anaerolineae bacterium]|nr:UDP-glucose/GDP-mannose dehydrogenase family protein [Anaerolineales bacterium]MCQ3976753.1 UDP-glucose 6-dehydrogenase [Anaerolineae bacterium]